MSARSPQSRQVQQEQLRALIGPEAVLTEPADTAGYEIDHRRLYQGSALAVLLPCSTEQVAAIVHWCGEQRIGLVPQGGNTSYCGGATPDESGSQVVVAMRRMNRIRAVDPANFSMIVESGCVLAAAQQAADAADRFFPLSLGSEGSCQIGGNLSTNAGGLNVVRYGMTRELVLGIEAVLPDGSVLSSLKSLRKDNTGYDLKSLLIGAEGTLGIITAATLKLWPRMRSSATALLAIETPAAALTLLAALRDRAGEFLSSFELMPRAGIELACRYVQGARDPFDRAYPWYLLCELTAGEAQDLDGVLQQALTQALENSWILDAVLASNERVRAELWFLREHIPEAQRRAGPSLKHDIAVPVASLAQFIDEASAWVHSHVPEGLLVCYGHAGDGNLHFNINRIGEQDRDAFLAREPQIKRAIHDLVARYRGSFSAEHGIGRLKRGELERYADPAALAAMRAIKQALDPLGIMNPGKLL